MVDICQRIEKADILVTGIASTVPSPTLPWNSILKLNRIDEDSLFMPGQLSLEKQILFQGYLVTLRAA